jgi:hypothetical protein
MNGIRAHISSAQIAENNTRLDHEAAVIAKTTLLYNNVITAG